MESVTHVYILRLKKQDRVLGSLEFGSVTYNTVIDPTQPNSRLPNTLPASSKVRYKKVTNGSQIPYTTSNH